MLVIFGNDTNVSLTSSLVIVIAVANRSCADDSGGAVVISIYVRIDSQFRQ